MPEQDLLFHSFKEPIDGYGLPDRFTFPFYYQPHPLCLLAAKQLQDYLETQSDWQRSFGLSGKTEAATGKMFGVLLVHNQQGEVGFLSAFSGKIADSLHHPYFVPPVFDMLEPDGFFRKGQDELTQFSNRIKQLESNALIAIYKAELTAKEDSALLALQEHRARMITGRKIRKEQRISAQKHLNSENLLRLNEALAKESIQQKNQLRDLKLYWEEQIKITTDHLTHITREISALKMRRRHSSNSLHKLLFDHYRFLNKDGVYKNLRDIFNTTPQNIPPAGAGECAAPKLLQYAFQHDLKPLAMAEFWWGQSPKSEIRKHKNFYPACLGKCRPILLHMLDGIEIDKNPLLTNPAEGKNIQIIYQDDVMVVINKPAGFLSVPGKDIEDSVFFRMKHRFPTATGPLIVHRLDMLTSGLMVIALTKDTHKKLQKQFIHRVVKKRYVALLDGLLDADNGIVDLPLRVDLDDRPRQLVCYEYGKAAQTKWHVIARNNQHTKVYFHPITGRTHQLRIHSAHFNGLNMAIVGDDLYGTKSKRLYLHAETLELNHPTTQVAMKFQVDAEF
ncbi:MAG TPA: RluA family pseudouridine synthase [Methylococcales bacterium]|nr:RluA family pseudouridine synthase [Methylococcales bacterium]